MSSVLLVPIHLDALYLAYDQPSVEAMANFTRLPYSDRQHDFNPDIAYISKEIVSSPFQNKNLNLKAGLHLHWSLPDALTKGLHDSTGIIFPAVPNRWLITRRNNNTMEKQWVIESDYLYPVGSDSEIGSVNIPIATDKVDSSGQPYRYLGRKMPFSAWSQKDPEATYLDKLTAVGYGEPTFAAFYPNCHSVFGFYDNDISDISADLQYEVWGWYNTSANDHLGTVINPIRNSEATDQDLLATLQEHFKWTIELTAEQDFPKQMMCYAQLTFNADTKVENSAKNTPVTLAVGNTSTEALTAYLAQEIDDSSKNIIEDQLQTIQLIGRLQQQQLDIASKLKESRHESSFVALSAGLLWTIKSETPVDVPANANDAQTQQQITLPENMAQQLNDLNLLQRTYDQALQEIESMRRRLFSDWYKYMICAYPPEDSQDEFPDIDKVKHYIEMKGVLSLQEKQTATGTLMFKANQLGHLESAKAQVGDPTNCLAAQMAVKINKLTAAIVVFNAKLAASASQEMGPVETRFFLKQISGSRYWQPAELVVTMVGQAVQPTDRYGQDGRLRADDLLECQLLEIDTTIQDIILKNEHKQIQDEIEKIRSTQTSEQVGFRTWSQQPWHPFLLEWEVELFPTKERNNLRPQSNGYDPDFLNSNYTLAENEVDLSVKSGKGAIVKAANVYSGHSILTSHATSSLKIKLEDYFKKQLMPTYYQNKNIPLEAQTDDYFSQKSSEILAWYKQTRCPNNSDPMCNLIDSYERLIAPDFYELSQALGGFNNALLMHKDMLQLDIADPLGFADYQPFVQAVREAVKERNYSAPVPLNDFNPIRSGVLKIRRLRLVDTFGQSRELDCSKMITTNQMTTPDNPHLVSLPPRLVQPARLNFRWLAANDNSGQEVNAHPDTTPICGWILPNFLDNSLMIYDNQGQSLGLIGSLNSDKPWQAAPGSPSAVAKIGGIPNAYLKKFVRHICNQKIPFLQNFITDLDKALENIEPENYAQHPDLALLIGRPIAVVRASLSLQLQGLPAVHHGWHAFRQDMQRNTRETDNFTHVEVPIRLGAYQQQNDGLIGYWLETDDGYENDQFYAPQNKAVIMQSVSTAPQTLTMLIDPRGKVHAASGILPVKAIDIPPDKYADALKQINVTFLSAPILTNQDQLNLPLPTEPGHMWSWLEKENDKWSETTAIGQINLAATFSGQQEIREGWLKLSPTEALSTKDDGQTESENTQTIV